VRIDREKILEAAQKLAAKGRYDKAIVEYRKILQENPNDDRIQLRVADAQMRMGAYDAAVSTYIAMADHFMQEGFHTKAVAMYKQARGVVQQHLAARADQFAHLLPKLARLYQDDGLVGEAVIIYDEYATILEKAGRQREALDVLRQLVDLRKDDGRMRARLVDALIAAGDTDGAIVELTAMAEQLVAAGRRDEAIQVYERIFAYRADPVVARTVAELYLDRGVPGDGVIALNRLQACFQSTQRDPATLRVLARALEAVGQRPKATEIRKLLLRTLLDAGDEEASRELVARLLVEAPSDDNVKQAAISLGMLASPLPRPSQAAPAPPPEVSVEPVVRRVSPPPLAAAEDSYNLEELEPESLGPLQYEDESFEDFAPADEGSSSSPAPQPAAEFPIAPDHALVEDTFADIDDYDDLDIDSPHPDPPALAAALDNPFPSYNDVAEREADTIRPAAPNPAEEDENLTAVLEEVAFYESQNLLDDALSLVEEHIPRYPDHPALLAQWRHLREALGLPPA